MTAGTSPQIASDHLPRDLAEALVLSAAREYFNSANSSDDVALDSATACLLVLPPASGSEEVCREPCPNLALELCPTRPPT